MCISHELPVSPAKLAKHTWVESINSIESNSIESIFPDDTFSVRAIHGPISRVIEIRFNLIWFSWIDWFGKLKRVFVWSVLAGLPNTSWKPPTTNISNECNTTAHHRKNSKNIARIDNLVFIYYVFALHERIHWVLKLLLYKVETLSEYNNMKGSAHTIILNKLAHIIVCDNFSQPGHLIWYNFSSTTNINVWFDLQRKRLICAQYSPILPWCHTDGTTMHHFKTKKDIVYL